jgi:hypothetical protein
MKYTLLDLTQTVLSSMDSDEVNSITDTVEAAQVANIIKTVYLDIISRANLPEHFSLFSLDASGDSSKPTLMTLPSTVSDLLWLKYNCETTTNTNQFFKALEYLSLPDFLNRMHGLNEDDTNVIAFSHTIDSSVVQFMYRNDIAPSCFTSFDDNTLIFDSYDATVDTTLQSSKTLAYGKLVIPFTLSDSFTPDLDASQFSLLLNEAKSLAWAELKQTQHTKAEGTARRQWVALQGSKDRVDHRSFRDRTPNYGRK